MSVQKLVSISVPTYNRAEDLDRCLGSILSQVAGLEDFVEVYVSNNASTDNTREIIKKYLDQGYPLIALENPTNLGHDGNLESLYEKANTPYFWLFGDDDCLMPGMLKPIVDVLRSGSYGIVYLPSRWFRGEFKLLDSEREQYKQFSYKVVPDTIEYLKLTHYWITFLTGNIINKGLVKDKVKVDRFHGSMMTYLGWFIPALFVGSKAVVEQNCIICKSTERGGYKVFETFGRKFSSILAEYVPEHGTAFKRVIEDNMAKSFFPQFTKGDPAFKMENYFQVLLPIYWRYPSFWKMMARTRIDAAKSLLKG